MSVRISISNHERNTTYYPGDTIDGRVYLRGPLRDENLSVSIKFWGSTYSEISLDKHSTRHYLQLCKVQRELFAGSCSLGEGAELSFPFSLTIPKYTFNYGGHRKNKYWAASAHDLPPTVATHGFRFDGRIGYELHAEARKSTFFSINTHKRKSIFLRRRGEPSSPSLLAGYRADSGFTKVLDVQITFPLAPK
jgi:hypothetical protein